MTHIDPKTFLAIRAGDILTIEVEAQGPPVGNGILHGVPVVAPGFRNDADDRIIGPGIILAVRSPPREDGDYTGVPLASGVLAHLVQRLRNYEHSEERMDNKPIHTDPVAVALLDAALVHDRQMREAEKAVGGAENTIVKERRIAAEHRHARNAILMAYRPPFPGEHLTPEQELPVDEAAQRAEPWP